MLRPGSVVSSCARAPLLAALALLGVRDACGQEAADPVRAGLPATRSAAAPSSLRTGTAIVRQGALEMVVRPLQGSLSVQSFYSYDVPVGSCANSGLETPEVSMLFLYEDTSVTPAALSMVAINDYPNDPTGGDAIFDITGLPAASTWAVKDDSYDGYAPDPPAGGATTATWAWGACCTDGGALDGLETAPFCIAVAPTFTDGVAQWQFLDGPSTSFPARRRLPSLTDTTYICGDCIDMACPPVITAGCAGGGSTAYVDVVIGATSLCGGEVVANDRTAGGADASGDYPRGTTTVRFTMTDAAGFTSSCSTDVVVQDDSSPPVVTSCPQPLLIDCAGYGDVPASDPRIASWLASFAAVDACGGVTVTDDAATFPAACNGTTTPVTFTATDAAGNTVSCSSSVTIVVQCFGLPADVGAALRATGHGDPYAADITADFEWTLDFGQPRPAGEHYHVLRGTDPSALGPVPGMEPWPGLSFTDSTPAATTLPFVHFYSILAASPCEDVSRD